MKTNDLMEKITNQILEDMEKGNLFWETPWIKTGNFPKNAATRKAYRGVNVIWLTSVASRQGFSCNSWLTYQQAKTAGGNIKAGAKGVEVIFFKPLTVKEEKAEGDFEKKVIKYLKYFTVFNLDQTEGLDHLRPKSAEEKPFNKNEEAERILTQSGAKIVEENPDKAFYSPTLDYINLPPRHSFKTEEKFFSTSYHELTHWSGHPKRLNRKQSLVFGSVDYAFEELVAEIGGAFLAGHVGYEYDTQHAAYVQNWIKVLKDDTRAIFRAASLAQSAADFILGVKFEKKEEAA